MGFPSLIQLLSSLVLCTLGFLLILRFVNLSSLNEKHTSHVFLKKSEMLCQNRGRIDKNEKSTLFLEENTPIRGLYRSAPFSTSLNHDKQVQLRGYGEPGLDEKCFPLFASI